MATTPKKRRQKKSTALELPAGAQLLQGDCMEVMATLEESSIDAVVTDPPYAIGRLAEERWDDAGMVRLARAEGRRLSPGEAFQEWSRRWAEGCLRVLKPGGHLLAFGSPRTVHRLACGTEDAGFEIRDELMWIYGSGMPKSRRYPGGLSTTLKPAYEPVVLARRPLQGNTEETIDAFGTGALNADACRVSDRHPANVLASHEPDCKEDRCAPGCAVALLDHQAAESRAGSSSQVEPSRIFYCPKVNRREREAGCEDLPGAKLDLFPRMGAKPSRPARNSHPCVKPLAVMRWLVRLSCPAGGTVLDPTCGSGSTGAATLLEGRKFVGIELDPEYARIAAARISHWAPPSGCEGRRHERAPLDRKRRRRR